MSLDFSVKDVANFEEVCYTEEGKFDPITETLALATMFLGINKISEANWKDFYARIQLWEFVSGPLIMSNGKFVPFDPEWVKTHIGLRSNASPISKSQFLDNMYNSLKEKVQ